VDADGSENWQLGTGNWQLIMRLDINLASQPYEDARQFWMRWGTGVGALALLTLILLTLDATGYVNARRDRASLAGQRSMIADRDHLRASAEEYLNRPQNRSTRDESQFLNGLIERKSFSWTRVLENLEKVMPPRVHLVAISPQLNEDNQLALKMTVAGDSRDRAIELTRHMEESKRFSQTQILSEHYAQSQTGDNEQFEIAAIYLPEPFVGADAAPADEKTVKAKKPASDSKPQPRNASAPAEQPKGGKH
jgi:Tfp pilus assembly protein PilN